VRYTFLNKLSKFIKVHKDALPHPSRSNVVYKIECADCDASYVGQISRCLKSCIAKHKNHINKSTHQTLAITEHKINTSHEFN